MRGKAEQRTVDGVLEVPIPRLAPSDILITEEDYSACVMSHTTPLFGCPVCFLLLAYIRPMARLTPETLAERVDKVRSHIAAGQRAKS